MALRRIFSPYSCESTDQRIFDTHKISRKKFSSKQQGFDTLLVEKTALRSIFSPNSCESTDQRVFDTHKISRKNFSSNQQGFDTLWVEKMALSRIFSRINLSTRF